MPSLSAIVPATNAPPTLTACLEAIRAADEPPEEVIVVDEGGGSGGRPEPRCVAGVGRP